MLGAFYRSVQFRNVPRESVKSIAYRYSLVYDSKLNSDRWTNGICCVKHSIGPGNDNGVLIFVKVRMPANVMHNIYNRLKYVITQ